MSYDLYFSRAEIPEQPPQLEQIGFADVADDWFTLPDPDAQATNERIEAALFRLDPRFVMYSAYYEALPGRMYEFGHENGLIIKLLPWRARLRLPYWYRDAAEARAPFKHLRRCAKAMQAAGNYLIFDPQLKKLVSLADDADAMLAAYMERMQAFGDALEVPWGDEPPTCEL
jgi:hypothetical protein